MDQENPAGIPPPGVKWDGDGEQTEQTEETTGEETESTEQTKETEETSEKEEKTEETEETEETSEKTEETEETGEEEEEEETVFYDPKEHFPDSDVHPNTFKDRFKALEGAHAKVNYLLNLAKDLDQAGVDVNVIDLPDVANGNVENLRSFLDIDNLDQKLGEDDQLRQFIFQADKTIPVVKKALEEEQREKTHAEKLSQLESDVSDLQARATDAVENIGVTEREYGGKGPRHLVKLIDQKIADADEDQRPELEDHKETILDYFDKVAELQDFQKQSKPEAGDADKTEKIQKAYNQFAKFNSGHEIFNAMDSQVLDSFLGFMEFNRDKYDMAQASEWKKGLKDFDNNREKLKKKYYTQKAKKEVTEQKTVQPPEKPERKRMGEPIKWQAQNRKFEDELQREKNNLVREMDAESRNRR